MIILNKIITNCFATIQIHSTWQNLHVKLKSMKHANIEPIVNLADTKEVI